MTRRRRLALAAAVVLALAGLGVLLWSFIAAQLIEPLALFAWLMLRIFVLSISQKTYWYVALFVLLISAFRLWPRNSSYPPYDRHMGGNVAIRTYSRWCSLFTLTEHDLGSTRNLRWELVRLLLSLYATKQHAEADLRLHEAMQRREVDLPDSIHSFLFASEPTAKSPSLLRRMRQIALAPLNWARRRIQLQQQRAECQRHIGEVLSFIENSLEMSDGNDDRKR